MSTHRVPELVVTAVTLLLPAGALRSRYRRELAAELHDLDERDRLGHALRFLLRVPLLRRVATSAPLHCRWHLFHHYVLRSTDDGKRYRRCRDCGQDDPTIPQVPDAMAWAGTQSPAAL